jgi:hypothetical protein
MTQSQPLAQGESQGHAYAREPEGVVFFVAIPWRLRVICVTHGRLARKDNAEFKRSTIPWLPEAVAIRAAGGARWVTALPVA